MDGANFGTPVARSRQAPAAFQGSAGCIRLSLSILTLMRNKLGLGHEPYRISCFGVREGTSYQPEAKARLFFTETLDPPPGSKKQF